MEFLTLTHFILEIMIAVLILVCRLLAGKDARQIKEGLKIIGVLVSDGLQDIREKGIPARVELNLDALKPADVQEVVKSTTLNEGNPTS